MTARAFDRESELYQESVDRAEKRIRDGDWQMSEFRDAHFNLSNQIQDAMRDAVSKRDFAEMGKLVDKNLVSYLLDKEMKT